MSFIISFETSTPACSVALHRSGELVGIKVINAEKSHSGSLVPMTKELLKEHGLTVQDLAAVAVSKGPGSYTGLRISTSTAKGICFAQNLPLIAIGTLEGMAVEMKNEASILIPMLDARRMEVYTQVFNTSARPVSEPCAEVLDEQSYSGVDKSAEILFFGSGAEKYQVICKFDNVRFMNDFVPSAKGIGILAWEKFQQQAFEDTAYFEPFYLKEFYTTAKKMF